MSPKQLPHHAVRLRHCTLRCLLASVWDTTRKAAGHCHALLMAQRRPPTLQILPLSRRKGIHRCRRRPRSFRRLLQRTVLSPTRSMCGDYGTAKPGSAQGPWTRVETRCCWHAWHNTTKFPCASKDGMNMYLKGRLLRHCITGGAVIWMTGMALCVPSS